MSNELTTHHEDSKPGYNLQKGESVERKKEKKKQGLEITASG